MSCAQPDCTARPTTFTPREPYSFSSLLKAGISLTQFSHQVAQKSSTTILSFRSCERNVCPSSCVSENSASGFDSCPIAVTTQRETSANARVDRLILLLTRD